MGSSAEARLFWGYCFTEENEIPGLSDDELNDFDAEERYALAVGVKRPAKEYDRNDEAVKADYSRFWEEKRKAEQASGCRVRHHGHYDTRYYYVAVSESEKSAEWGSPEEITADHMAVPTGWHKKLADYCEKMGIKPKGEPRWWLAAYYG